MLGTVDACAKVAAHAKRGARVRMCLGFKFRAVCFCVSAFRCTCSVTFPFTHISLYS